MIIDNKEAAELHDIQQAFLSLILNLYGGEEYALLRGWSSLRREMMEHYNKLGSLISESDRPCEHEDTGYNWD